jgi:hypothetical protein
MGWGLEINGINLPGVNKEGLEVFIGEKEGLLTFYRDKLMMLVSHSPDQSKEEWLDNLQMDMSSLLEDLNNAYLEKVLAEIALEDLENVKEY